MDQPVDYGEVAGILAELHGLPAIPLRSDFHSTWLSNARARFELNWRPAYDTRRLVTESRAFSRAPDDPRGVWYPGLPWPFGHTTNQQQTLGGPE